MAEPQDISTYPFKMNAPIHPSLLHQAPALGAAGAGQKGTNLRSKIYDAEQLNYQSGAPDKTFQNLRLGRMVMGKQALSYAMQQSKTRYGFRFLYNPSEVRGGTNVGTDFIPDPQNTVMFVLQEGLEIITFELFLNRTPEVAGRAKASDYIGFSLDPDEFREIQEYGTHYDLEYLYRLSNGTHDTNQKKNTGDIGILLPNPCELFLGPFRSRGALVSMSATDIVYSERMVPMLTYVQVSFARYLTMSDEGIETLKSTGVGGVGGGNDEDSSSSSSGGSSGDVSNKQKLEGKEVYDLALGAGWKPSQATTMTQIAWGESGWKPGAHNNNRSTGDNSYGLWQINMIDSLGPARRKQFGISSNEELKDPVINAKAAFMVVGNGTTFQPWTVYTSGKYLQAPTW
jgi:hypothetical protein